MIARLNGQIVLVGGAIPGERVTARVERVGKGVVYADTIGVDTASADRRAVAADPLCGGCVYAHIGYARQLEIKAQVIADAFGRIGRLMLPAAVRVVPSPEDGYRMRARLHVRGRRAGFYREGTHEMCDVRQTRQLLPASCDALESFVSELASLGLDTVREIELSENVDASERALSADVHGRMDAADARAAGGNRRGDGRRARRVGHRSDRHRRCAAGCVPAQRAVFLSGQPVSAARPRRSRRGARAARTPTCWISMPAPACFL